MNKVKKYTEERPWGKFEQFTQNQRVTVKIITVNPGGLLSLQYHNFRDEFWHILEGEPLVIIGNESVTLASAGDEFFIPKRTLHRIGAPETGRTVRFLEIAYGKFDENDIVRLADNYNRVKT